MHEEEALQLETDERAYDAMYDEASSPREYDDTSGGTVASGSGSSLARYAFSSLTRLRRVERMSREVLDADGDETAAPGGPAEGSS